MKNSSDFQEDSEFQIPLSLIIQNNLKIYVYSENRADPDYHSLLK